LPPNAGNVEWDELDTYRGQIALLALSGGRIPVVWEEKSSIPYVKDGPEFSTSVVTSVTSAEDTP
jgi:hypothetical protein